MDAPAFPTQRGTRRNKDNVRQKVVEPVVARANDNRARRDEPPIRAHVTPHTLRRTYITYAIAAGLDIPYVQAQVGHSDPTVTLAVYAQVMRRPDRDHLRAEIRGVLGVDQAISQERPSSVRGATTNGRQVDSVLRLRAAQTAAKGRKRPHSEAMNMLLLSRLARSGRLAGYSPVPPAGLEPAISCVKGRSHPSESYC